MTFGESREQGVTRGRNFYHEPLGIALTAPQGWKIQNTPKRSRWSTAKATPALIVQDVPAKAGNKHEEIIRNVLKPDRGASSTALERPVGDPFRRHPAATSRARTQSFEVTVVSGPSNQDYLMVYAAKDAPTRCSAPPPDAGSGVVVPRAHARPTATPRGRGR